MIGERKLKIFRAIDKLNRLGPDNVWLLLTTGREDESGDFSEGAGLSFEAAKFVMLAVGFKLNLIPTGENVFARGWDVV